LKLLKSKDDRIKDQGLFATALQKTSEVVAALTVEINRSSVAAFADTSRTSAGLTVSVQNLQKSVESLDGEVAALRDEQVRIAAILTSNTGQRGRGR
jgi:hypothetical protein